MATPSLPAYAALLHAALARTPACVGLDPVAESLPDTLRAEHWEPVRAIEHFCRGVLDAVAPQVRIVKPQSACFERYGSAGVGVLERTIRHARDLGLLVILDAKRGDIGVSAAHYAAAAVGMGAHAITVNAYLGMETVEPYLEAGLGVFVLVRTSNPGSDAVQSRRLAEAGGPADGHAGGTAPTVAEMMARQVHALARPHPRTSDGLSVVGAVVGATKAGDGPAMRRAMPDTPFLVPGYGAQGGTADDVRRLLRAGGGGVIVNSSRGVLYPKPEPGQGWQAAVWSAATTLVTDLASVLAGA